MVPGFRFQVPMVPGSRFQSSRPVLNPTKEGEGFRIHFSCSVFRFPFFILAKFPSHEKWNMEHEKWNMLPCSKILNSKF
jgi:hypothetical protein